MNIKQKFKEYVERTNPLPWTVVKEHDNPHFLGSSSMLLSYVRFRLIMETVNKYFENDMTILDVGVYPGNLPKIVHEFYPGNGKYKYYGCGMGFSKPFSDVMVEMGVTLLEADLDPRLNLQKGRADKILLPDEFINLGICTDVIEHFFDPFYMLKELNRVMKKDGILILTTDNISRLISIISLIKGKSNSLPLMESHIFFEGDWRPHFREYSKGELVQLLKYAGFEVMKHQYYESEYAEYNVVDKKLIKKAIKRGVAGEIKHLMQRLLTELMPSLRDNHIIVARKVVSYEAMQKNSPKVTANYEEWMQQRKKYKQYDR